MSFNLTPADLSPALSDISANNTSLTAHGYCPKLGGGTINFLRADGQWATPAGATPYDDWANVRSILTILTSQLAATRMGFSDGWIDSLTDTTGLAASGSIGSFQNGYATSTVAGTAIPMMTSNTAPSGVASASTIFDASYDAWKAFNRVNAAPTDAWLTGSVPSLASSATWQWLKYDFGVGASVNVQTYYVTSRNYADATNPKTWNLQGSNDNSNWSDTHSVSGDNSWTQNQTKQFTCTTPGSYRYYRMLIKEGTGPTYLAIGELDLRTPASNLIMESAPTVTPSGASNFFIDLSVSNGANMTVKLDTGNGSGLNSVTMTRTPVSATVDQLVGVVSVTGASSSARVQVTASSLTDTAYGWSLFWR